jgi:hypothetical protein
MARQDPLRNFNFRVEIDNIASSPASRTTAMSFIDSL